MTRPRLLDLFCCQGGAAMGYSRAGFDVVGVDIVAQPRYPFEFHQGDALEYLAAHGHEFDAIHASPPCQAYSATKSHPNVGAHPDLVGPTRDLLRVSGKPYAIENVPGAPLLNYVTLCGTMFGLRVIRHRLFECSPALLFAPFSCRHHLPVVKWGKSPNPDNEFHSVVGHLSNVPYARAAMGIDWMAQDGLAQAIPPAYTEFIGRHLLEALKATP